MDNNVVINYDRICLGRYAPVQVMDGPKFNNELNRGVSYDLFMAYEKNTGYGAGRMPYQVYEYCVDGVWYRRAHIVTFRNSGILNSAVYGNECVVIYNSQNPGFSQLNKNIGVAAAKQQYGLLSLVGQWPAETVNLQAEASNPVNEPYKIYKEYETTKLEYAAAIVGMASFFLGVFIWILGPIALILSLKSLLTEKRNRKLPVFGMITGALGTAEIMASIMMIISLVAQFS